MFFKRIINSIYIRLYAFFNFVFINSSKVNEKWVYLKSVNKIDSFENIEDIPKKIWMYWDSQDSNPIVDLCYENTKNLCKNYEVVLLNKNNVSNYVDISKINPNLKPQIIADYIRLKLLNSHGGIWMDASILLTQNFDWIYRKINKKQDVFVFYSDDCTTDENNPIVENWFIMAPKGNEFIGDWFQEFEKCVLSDNPYTYYSSYKGNTDVIQNIQNTDYLMCYISAAIVMSKRRYNIVTLNSGSSGHYYNYKFKFRSIFIALTLCLRRKEKLHVPYLIKFTQDSRDDINLFIRKNFIVRRSLIGSSFQKIYNSQSI